MRLTANDTGVAYGTAMVDVDPERIDQPTALGLDETLLVRMGRGRRQQWSTSIADVGPGRLVLTSQALLRSIIGLRWR